MSKIQVGDRVVIVNIDDRGYEYKSKKFELLEGHTGYVTDVRRTYADVRFDRYMDFEFEIKLQDIRKLTKLEKSLT